MTLNQYMKMSRKALKAKLKRQFTKQINSMTQLGLARLCYTMQKSKLPRLNMRVYGDSPVESLPKRKKKRKFSRKQLAAQRLFAKRVRAGTLRKRQR